MVRVHARSGEEYARMLPGQLQSLLTTLQRGTRYDHLHDALLSSAFQHLFAIAVERVVSKIGADINQACVQGMRSESPAATSSCTTSV